MVAFVKIKIEFNSWFYRRLFNSVKYARTLDIILTLNNLLRPSNNKVSNLVDWCSKMLGCSLPSSFSLRGLGGQVCTANRCISPYNGFINKPQKPPCNSKRAHAKHNPIVCLANFSGEEFPVSCLHSTPHPGTISNGHFVWFPLVTRNGLIYFRMNPKASNDEHRNGISFEPFC